MSTNKSSLIYFHQLSLLCCFWNSIIWKSFSYYLSFLRWFSNFLFCCFYFFWATSWGISATLHSGPSLGVVFLSFCYCIFNFYELSFVPEHYIFVISYSFFMAVRSSVICLREGFLVCFLLSAMSVSFNFLFSWWIQSLLYERLSSDVWCSQAYHSYLRLKTENPDSKHPMYVLGMELPLHHWCSISLICLYH